MFHDKHAEQSFPPPIIYLLLKFLSVKNHTFCLPDCRICLSCSHRATFMSSFDMEDRLFSCHLPRSSEATAERKHVHTWVTAIVNDRAIHWRDYQFYMHQESFLGSSHISPQMKVNFGSKAVLPQRNPSELQYRISCKVRICLSGWDSESRIRKLKRIYTITYARKGWRTSPGKDTFLLLFSLP